MILKREAVQPILVAVGGGVFGVLLGFMVFSVWPNLSKKPAAVEVVAVVPEDRIEHRRTIKEMRIGEGTCDFFSYHLSREGHIWIDTNVGLYPSKREWCSDYKIWLTRATDGYVVEVMGYVSDIASSEDSTFSSRGYTQAVRIVVPNGLRGK